MTIFLSPYCNGERVVVFLLIARVLASLPSYLLFHGVLLCLLAMVSLCVEVIAEGGASLSHFKTRPGASSGILLGAVTLPTVMLSKLIQLSRALEVQRDELDVVAMQYWASCASSCGVLIFLCRIIWRMLCSVNSDPYCGWPAARFKLSRTFLCVPVAAAIFLSYGSLTSLKFLWVLLHGFAAVKLVQHTLDIFPCCASIGETLLVNSGLVAFLSDMLACTFSQLPANVPFLRLVFVQFGVKKNEISTIIQGLLFGLLILPVIFKLLLWIWNQISNSSTMEKISNERGAALTFFVSLYFIMMEIMPLWMQYILDFHGHPLLWVIKFIFSEPFKRLSLCVYWGFVGYVSIVKFYNISKTSKIERILLRKYYHLMAVLLFLPAVVFQPKFLDLAFGAALALFLLLEIIRVWRIWPLGQVIHRFMSAFTDHRDSDLLIVSHFSLLLGCALPIWMSSSYNDRPLTPFAGILSLGIGDTMASMVGHKYGVIRWSKTAKKTVEGTAAGVTSVLAACVFLLPLLASAGYIVVAQKWGSLIVAVVLSGLLEAYTTQLDNAFIPLVFYSLLCL